jgi:hypothetical protein
MRPIYQEMGLLLGREIDLLPEEDEPVAEAMQRFCSASRPR